MNLIPFLANSSSLFSNGVPYGPGYTAYCVPPPIPSRRASTPFHLFNKTLLLLISFLYFPFHAFTQFNYREIIEYLAADSLEGRAPGSIGELKSSNFIEKKLKETGNQVFLQKFKFNHNHKNIKSKNVIGYINNHQTKSILILAHYDHLGWGNDKSKEITNRNQIHNGADDNASGIALIISLAHFINQNKLEFNHYNYIFLASSAHELGLFGATHFTKSKIFKTANIKLTLNFDMVGRMDIDNPIIKIGGVNSDTTAKNFFEKLNSEQLKLRFSDDQIETTDASVFHSIKIPTLSFTTGVHDDYHKSTDDSFKINYTGLNKITDICIQLLVNFNQKTRFN